MAKQIMYRTVKSGEYGPWRKPMTNAAGHYVLPSWIINGGFDDVVLTDRDEFQVGDKFSVSGYTVTILSEAVEAKRTNGETYNQYSTKWVDDVDGETFYDYVSEINLSGYERA